MKYKMGFNNILPFVLESEYSNNEWTELIIGESEINLDLRSQNFHYGQSIFEGIKIYVNDSNWKIFRLKDHLLRFNESAKRLDMPTIKIDDFIEEFIFNLKKIKKNISQEIDYIYIRPMMYSSSNSIKVSSGDRFSLKILFSILKDIEYPDIDVWVEKNQARSFHGGTGNIKFSGNYAPTFNIQRKASKNNCDTVLWLGNTFVEEMTSMNIFFYDKEFGWITPKINDKFLNGITRRSFISCFEAKEKKLQWLDISNRIKEKKIIKAIGTGTAIGFRIINSFCEEGNFINLDSRISKSEIKKYNQYILSISQYWLEV